MAQDYSHLDKILAENERWDGITGASGVGKRDRLNPAQRAVLDYLKESSVLPESCAIGNYIPEDQWKVLVDG